MSPDRGRVRTRLAYLKDQAEALRRLFADSGLQDLAAEGRETERAGVKYRVQTAAEAMMDVAYHLCAAQWHHAPADPHDAFDFLAAQGMLPRERLPAWHKLVGTRNRLVHGYLDVSEDRFLREVAAGLPDLDAFVAAVAGWLRD